MESNHPYNLDCAWYRHDSVAYPTSVPSSGVSYRPTTTSDCSCTGTVSFSGDPDHWVGSKVSIGEQQGSGTLITVEHGWVSRKEVRILLKLSAYQHAYGVSSCFEQAALCLWLAADSHLRQVCKDLVGAPASLDWLIPCILFVDRSQATGNRFTEKRQPRRPDGRNRYLYVMGRYF